MEASELKKAGKILATFHSTCENCLHTFVEDLEAAVGAAVVSGEEQVQEVAAAEQELRHVGSVE